MDFMKMMRRAGLLLLAAFALVATSLPAAAVDIEKVVSKGGIEAWLVRDAKNPIIALQFAMEGGTEHDPADKLGLAIMATSLMDEGAGDLDSQAFQGKLDENSISLSFSAGRDGIMGQGHHPARNQGYRLRPVAPCPDQAAF